VICKTFSEMGIEIPAFPSEEELQFNKYYKTK
jgi:hypothetical protein